MLRRARTFIPRAYSATQCAHSQITATGSEEKVWPRRRLCRRVALQDRTRALGGALALLPHLAITLGPPGLRAPGLLFFLARLLEPRLGALHVQGVRRSAADAQRRRTRADGGARLTPLRMAHQRIRTERSAPARRRPNVPKSSARCSLPTRLPLGLTKSAAETSRMYGAYAWSGSALRRRRPSSGAKRLSSQ